MSLESKKLLVESIRHLGGERVRDTFGTNKSVEHRLEQSNNQALEIIERCEQN